MDVNRRTFLASCAGGLAANALARQRWRDAPRLKDGVETRGSARNLVFILLLGGPSQVDSFDLKPGPYTPDFFEAADLGGGLRWPGGIMPKLANLADRFSIVRGISAMEAVHRRAMYHLQTGHRLNAAMMREIPHFLSVMSYKMAGEKKAGDTLPTAMVMGANLAKNGFLAQEHRGVEIGSSGSLDNLSHDFERYSKKIGLLQEMWDMAATPNQRIADHLTTQDQALRMMADPDLQALLSEGAQGDRSSNAEYYNQDFYKQCEVVVKLLELDKGARVFQMYLPGWDHHQEIYSRISTGSLPSLCGQFDNGFAYLLESLAAKPGVNAPTLLDETMIVAMGEFGRTISSLNRDEGRDHYPYAFPAVVAGGGVIPGRLIGATDPLGGYPVDPGWSRNRYITVNDMIATMFSATGIDWTERILDTPSGRLFEFVETSILGDAFEINTMFE